MPILQFIDQAIWQPIRHALDMLTDQNVSNYLFNGQTTVLSVLMAIFAVGILLRFFLKPVSFNWSSVQRHSSGGDHKDG